MSDFKEIGRGGFWIKEGKKGKFLSWEATFTYNGQQVTARGVAFKNDKKEGNQPDYNMKVNEAFPAKAKEANRPHQEEDIPY